MDNKEQAKDFEKVDGAQLSDEEQENVNGATVVTSKMEAQMVDGSSDFAAAQKKATDIF